MKTEVSDDDRIKTDLCELPNTYRYTISGDHWPNLHTDLQTITVNFDFIFSGENVKQAIDWIRILDLLDRKSRKMTRG